MLVHGLQDLRDDAVRALGHHALVFHEAAGSASRFPPSSASSRWKKVARSVSPLSSCAAPRKCSPLNWPGRPRGEGAARQPRRPAPPRWPVSHHILAGRIGVGEVVADGQDPAAEEPAGGGGVDPRDAVAVPALVHGGEHGVQIGQPPRADQHLRAADPQQPDRGAEDDPGQPHPAHGEHGIPPDRPVGEPPNLPAAVEDLDLLIHRARLPSLRWFLPCTSAATAPPTVVAGPPAALAAAGPPARSG